MSEELGKAALAKDVILTHRIFHRFTVSQRWEHMLLLISFTVVLLTGLPQKYRTARGATRSSPRQSESI